MKEWGLKWEETGAFSLGADVVPKLNEEEVRKSVFELNSKNKILNHLVKLPKFRYALKLNETPKAGVVKNNETVKNPRADEDYLSKRRADGVFMSWLNQYKEQSRVEMNQQVLK